MGVFNDDNIFADSFDTNQQDEEIKLPLPPYRSLKHCKMSTMSHSNISTGLNAELVTSLKKHRNSTSRLLSNGMVRKFF